MHEKTTFTMGNIFNRLHDEVAVARSRLTSDTISLDMPYRAYPKPVVANLRCALFFGLQRRLDTLVNYIPRDILHLNPYTPRPSGLGDLLSLTRDRQCSNELDKVYALYGLSPVARVTYPPDYRKTIGQINHETTSFILEHEANINIFNDFDFCFNSANKDESLPSWVVDFTTTDPKHREKMQQSFSKTMNLDKALWEQSRDHAPIVADDMQTLKLWCRKVGVSLGLPYVLDSEVPRCMTQAQLAVRIMMNQGKDRDHCSNIHDTVIKAAYYYTDSSNLIPLSPLIEIMKTHHLPGEFEQWEVTFKTYLIATYLIFEKLAGKRLFSMAISTGSSIGFTDCDIEKGDLLVIPCGIAQVFVLRPIPEKLLVEGEEAQCFKVIGRAYVEGISDREEVMPHPLRSEMERTSPALFCLR